MANTQNQVVKNVFEQLKDQARDTAKKAVQEPKKIAQTVVGEPSQSSKKDAAPAPQEQSPTGGSTQQNPQNQQAQSLEKQIQEEQKTQKLINVYRQRLEQEEKEYRAKTKQLDQQKIVEEQQAEQAKQNEIIQLRREKEREAVLQGPSKKQTGPVGPLGMVKKKQGSREQGRLKD